MSNAPNVVGGVDELGGVNAGGADEAIEVIAAAEVRDLLGLNRTAEDVCVVYPGWFSGHPYSGRLQRVFQEKLRIVADRKELHAQAAFTFEENEWLVSFLSIILSAATGVMSFCGESPLTSVEAEKVLAVFIGVAACVSSMLQSFNGAYGSAVKAKAHRTASKEYGELLTWMQSSAAEEEEFFEDFSKQVLDIRARCRYFPPDIDDGLGAGVVADANYDTGLPGWYNAGRISYVEHLKKIKRLRNDHVKEARSYEKCEQSIVFSSIVLTFASGVLGFLVTSTLIASETSTSPSDSDTEFTDTQNGFLLTVSCLAVVTMTLQGCGKAFGWAAKGENHRTAAEAYDNLLTRTQPLFDLPRDQGPFRRIGDEILRIEKKSILITGGFLESCRSYWNYYIRGSQVRL